MAERRFQRDGSGVLTRTDLETIIEQVQSNFSCWWKNNTTPKATVTSPLWKDCRIATERRSLSEPNKTAAEELKTLNQKYEVLWTSFPISSGTNVSMS